MLLRRVQITCIFFGFGFVGSDFIQRIYQLKPSQQVPLIHISDGIQVSSLFVFARLGELLILSGYHSLF
jgi:hypothetical protein